MSDRPEQLVPQDNGNMPKDWIVDIDRAEVMAHAGHKDRSEAAFQRSATELMDEYGPQDKELQGAITGATVANDPPERMRLGQERRSLFVQLGGKLREFIRIYPLSVNSSYPGWPVHDYPIGADSLLYSTDSGGPIHKPSFAKAERADERAERLENWANRLYDQPDSEITAEQAGALEDWIAEERKKLAESEAEIQELQERSKSGDLSIVEVLERLGLVKAVTEAGKFRGVDGFLEEVEEDKPNEGIQRLKKGLHRDQTTIGEIKKFLFEEVLRESLKQRRAQIEAKEAILQPYLTESETQGEGV